MTVKKVQIREMSVRDGLQNEKQIIPTQDKIDLIQNLINSGINYIEATAFVSPKAIPQMADAVELSRRLPKNDKVIFSALVPNLQGFENAIQAYDFKEIAVFTAASETFNQKNINTSIAGSFERFAPVIKAAHERKIRVRGYVSTAFVCPYEGKIKAESTMEVINKLLDIGCYEVSIGDTIGKAVPTDIDMLFALIQKKNWVSKCAGHYHDTYGNAVNNVLETLKWGVSVFDSSAGGIGGCPYAPGASGNVSTEALVAQFDQMKIETGINLSKLSKATTQIAKLLKRKLKP